MLAGVAGLVAARPPAASAADTLDHAAAVLRGEPVLGPGQFIHTSTRDWALAVEDRGGERFRYFHEGMNEIWKPQDWRDGEWFRRYSITGERRWIAGDEASARAAAGVHLQGPSVIETSAVCGAFTPELGQVERCPAGTWRRPTPDFLAGLPRDPDALRAELVANSAGDGPVALVAGAPSTGWAPRDLRAAFYRALAGLPDVRITDHTADLDGRVGTAFGSGDEMMRTEIVIDTQTGRYLGGRLVSTAEWQGLPAGTVWSSAAVTTSIVDSGP